ncbi:cytochrome b/b6 domain-containing protein [Desulfobulbus rhabdoformis]|uniref:cytochrome b/b6 domain-containing protein n=1 Tax=Desulfobulbus rhabdoformis TaxID=34032 RepID=UPI0019666D0D|nr:cytochrome b/b6 domain-containing protein [Desulfobulbus rhabdoformis]MBM9615683.1 cytochrome b/b6 domain-containing protein [Desulfobulbus rhabdoformis]
MSEKKQIVVWDMFIRVFHWSLLPLFFVAYVTGDDKGPLHRYVGYVVLLLVIARICWGFWGTKYARFSDFICSPAKGINYLKELVGGKPTHYIGHNPAASWMILLLITNSILICLSGYAAYATKGENPSFGLGSTLSIVENAYADDEKEEEDDDDEENEGSNNAGKDAIEGGSSEKKDNDGDSIWSDIHEMSAQFMLFLICLHIVGVAVSSKMHNENLVKGIITGKKDIKSE